MEQILKRLGRHVFVGAAAMSVVFTASVAPSRAQESDAEKMGHSRLHQAHDEGPRQRPVKMDGIGEVDFPITTSVPEVQEWFNQGVALLHNYWYYEAERSFRWCLKLDPDCAMAYWGLEMATSRPRNEHFLEEAIKRKGSVTERERMYIEALEESQAFDPVENRSPARSTRMALYLEKLEEIILKYPDDLEAKAFYIDRAKGSRGGYPIELMIREILAVAPEHPGAHHYRIHNWDGRRPEQALDSCEVFGRIASDSGHANHMPGHVYSDLGMWHEAAIWLERATRRERSYFAMQFVQPFESWNYAHNQTYLAWVQEQLGLADEAERSARELLRSPADPEKNDVSGYDTYNQGVIAFVRGLVRFERWDTIVAEEEAITKPGTIVSKVFSAYALALAHLNESNLDLARAEIKKLHDLQDEISNPSHGWLKPYFDCMLLETRAMFALSEGDELNGFALLADGARREHVLRETRKDPPIYPRGLYVLLGEKHLDHGSPQLARECFLKTLEVSLNDGFALSGLARAEAALGNDEAAASAWARLQHVWSGASPDERWLADAAALGIEADPFDDSPRPQRSYESVAFDAFGPDSWQPFSMPKLDPMDATGQTVDASSLAGRNAVIVFYLGEECPHCMDQLRLLKSRHDEFEEVDTDVVAISADSVEEIAESLEMGKLPFQILSDPDHRNAKRFRSYDDFEEIELHSTFLVDRLGRVHWSRIGGEPFEDLDFLLGEIERVNKMTAETAAATPVSR
ncbi:MAG: redoxin domain-containing protein [Planctomycetota bacterium]